MDYQRSKQKIIGENLPHLLKTLKVLDNDLDKQIKREEVVRVYI